jgi:Uma2 family endonuclease
MDVAAELGIEYKRPPEGLVTFEEFLEWCEPGTHAEWVDGRVILLHVTVAERHDFVVRLLGLVFSAASRLGLFGDVHGEPFQMKLSPRLSRTPDLFFVTAERRHLFDRHYLNGPADIALEVISPESVRRDRVVKLAEYERHGVREYWIADAQAESLEIRVLQADGTYRLAFAGTEGTYASAVLPELRVRAEWLWQTPGPDLSEVLRELGL